MKNAVRISGVILVILSIFFINSCKKDKPTPPIISTTAVSTISYTTATSGGAVTNEGGAAVTAKGVCWNTSPDPTVSNNKTSDGTGTGSFSSSLIGLTAGTTYYVRAYATNTAGTGYGNQVTFITSQIALATLTTAAITSITSTTAVSGGNITADNGGSVTARGVCWGTATNPTIALSSKTTDGTGTGSFVSNLINLQPGTIYYVRSYATNSLGTSYGNEISFTTLQPPTATTAAATSLASTTATLNGTVNANNQSTTVTFEYGTTISYGQTINAIPNTVSSNTNTSVSAILTGLTASTTYHFRIKAVSSGGTAYGNELTFTTSAATTQVQWALETVISTGAYSSGIAITPDNSKIIVTNNTTPGTIKVISTSNYSISSISYPADGYPNGVAVTPNGLTAVVNTMHQTIFINLSTNSVSGNFAAPCVGTTLYGIAVTPNGNNAIFPDLSSGCTQQGLRSINITTPSGSSFIQVNTSGVLYGIAITPDGTSAIVTTAVLGSPKKVNLLTSGVQNISDMTGSYGVAILHNGNEALIVGDSLKRVSLTSNKVTKNISDIYSTTFQSIAITADDKYAFVVGDFKKIVVSLTDNTVIQTFSAGGTNVATTSDGSRFFVTNSYNGTVSVYKKVIPAGM